MRITFKKKKSSLPTIMTQSLFTGYSFEGFFLYCVKRTTAEKRNSSDIYKYIYKDLKKIQCSFAFCVCDMKSDGL